MNGLVREVDRLVRVDKVDEALELIAGDITANPGISSLEDARGRVLYRRGELMPAIEAFNLSIRIDPCNGRAHYDAWRVEAMAGLYEAAQKQLEIAHSVDPKALLLQRVWANTQMVLPAGVVADVPPHFSFYARHVDCDGIPMRSAAVVNPVALTAACGHIQRMLEHLPNVRANLVARGAELHIMGEDQAISDLPEFRNERGERVFSRPGQTGAAAVKVDVDAYAGALGGIYANCPEINLMHMPGDGYGVHDEVCVHEFAHDIMNAGFDFGMREQIEKQFKASTGKGRWKGAYAATNPNEWWAELSAWYFGAQGGVSKMEPPVPEPGPEALKAYDPEAFALLDRFYSGQKQPKVIRLHEAKVVKSVDGGRNSPYPAEVLFINNTAGRRFVYWIDPGGTPRSYGFVEPYSRKTYQCFNPDFWMVVDPRTKAEVIFRVDDAETQATIQ
jgi:tetratricopeptide (TPR) repeat protein